MRTGDTLLATQFIGTRPTGSEKLWTDATGLVHVVAIFGTGSYDGSETHQILRLSSAGWPLESHTSTRRTRKWPLDPAPDSTTSWVRTNGDTIMWNDGQATRTLIAPGPIWIMQDWAWLESALLAQRQLAHPKEKVRVFSDGELWTATALRSIDSLTLRHPGGAVMARLYEMNSDEGPEHLWLDDHGKFVATGDGEVVRSDLVQHVATLMHREDSRVAAQMAALATRLGTRFQTGFAVTHATLVDVESGVAREHMTVLVRGRRIVAVEADSLLTPPADAHVIDAAGKWLMPGLWDLHTHTDHYDDDAFRPQLAAGITGRRDLGTFAPLPFGVLPHQRRVDAGRETGPRVVSIAGYIDGSPSVAAMAPVTVSTVAEALHAVDRYADSGYDQIKVYEAVPPKLVGPIALRARERGLRVSGHIPRGMTVEQAVRAGYDEINHVSMIGHSFTDEYLRDTSILETFHRAADLSVRDAPFQHLVALMVEHHVAIDPTLAVSERRLTRPGLLPSEMVADTQLVARWLGVMKAMIAEFYRAGITILPGTDRAGSIPRELEIYAEAGIPTAAVLRMATISAARYLHRDRDFGSIRPGKLADMILLDANPLDSIGALRKVNTVFKDGVMYDPHAVASSSLGGR
jgi:imidazolonepropionase-like amidohydrolase